MKTKISLILLVCVVLTSCSKWRWHDHHNNEDEVVLTEDNYMFEGDLYKYALSAQIDSLEVRAEFLKDIIGNNQGTPEIEEDLEQTTKALDETIEIEQSVLSSDAVFRRVPRGNGPRPPRPTVIPTGLRYIVMNELVSLDLLLTNEEGQEVAQTEGDIQTLARTRGSLQYIEVKLFDPEYEGPVKIQVRRINDEGQEADYELEAFKKAGN